MNLVPSAICAGPAQTAVTTKIRPVSRGAVNMDDLGILSLLIISPGELATHKLKTGRTEGFVDVRSALRRRATALDHAYIFNWAESQESKLT